MIWLSTSMDTENATLDMESDKMPLKASDTGDTSRNTAQHRLAGALILAALTLIMLAAQQKSRVGASTLSLKLSLPPSQPPPFQSPKQPLSNPPLTSPPTPPSVIALATRLEWVANASRRARQQALAELAAGQKRGHWIWWVFPTLAARGGDMNSAWQHADLADVNEAAAYASHTELRQGLLSSFRAASAAFAAVATRDQSAPDQAPRSGEGDDDASSDGGVGSGGEGAGGDVGRSRGSQAPWQVLDRGFWRRADGTWVKGPVDSFKLWNCATLFAALAQQSHDAELQVAADLIATDRH